MSTAVLMTVEQFAEMQTGETEDYELVEGELIPLSSGTPLHCLIRDCIGVAVHNYFGRNAIGRAFAELDCRLSEFTVRRPDLSIFLADRAKSIDLTRTPVPFAPDIAVEVLSPSEKAVEVNRRALDYLRAGSKEVWLIDPVNREAFIQTHGSIRLIREKDSLESPLLPGFCAVIEELFGGD